MPEIHPGVVMPDVVPNRVSAIVTPLGVIPAILDSVRTVAGTWPVPSAGTSTHAGSSRRCPWSWSNTRSSCRCPGSWSSTWPLPRGRSRWQLTGARLIEEIGDGRATGAGGSPGARAGTRSRPGTGAFNVQETLQLALRGTRARGRATSG